MKQTQRNIVCDWLIFSRYWTRCLAVSDRLIFNIFFPKVSFIFIPWGYQSRNRERKISVFENGKIEDKASSLFRVKSWLSWGLAVIFFLRFHLASDWSRNNNIPEIFSGVHCVTGKTVSVSFTGIMKLRQRPHKSPVGVKFKFSDEYSLPFHMGAPPPGFPNV